ncbi:Hypothetical predicted protein, partial [Paramuricea clavata]
KPKDAVSSSTPTPKAQTSSTAKPTEKVTTENVPTTQSTTFRTGKRLDKKLDSLDLQIELNNTTIEQADVFSLLGLKIDMRLTFDEHVDSLCNKLSQRIGVLRKIKVFLPLEQRILYYNLDRVLRLQKRAAKVILDAVMRANSAELFKKLNWLPFFCEVKM